MTNTTFLPHFGQGISKKGLIDCGIFTSNLLEPSLTIGKPLSVLVSIGIPFVVCHLLEIAFDALDFLLAISLDHRFEGLLWDYRRSFAFVEITSEMSVEWQHIPLAFVVQPITASAYLDLGCTTSQEEPLSADVTEVVNYLEEFPFCQ